MQTYHLLLYGIERDLRHLLYGVFVEGGRPAKASSWEPGWDVLDCNVLAQYPDQSQYLHSEHTYREKINKPDFA